jgi:hypothetical protein
MPIWRLQSISVKGFFCKQLELHALKSYPYWLCVSMPGAIFELCGLIWLKLEMQQEKLLDLGNACRD